MKFENAFDVRAPAEDVWEALMDVERVAPCMPGAEVLERVSDEDYKVGIKVKLGPISMLYRGQIEIVERDDAARRATMRAKAKEARGQGTADASVQMAVSEADGVTHASMTTEVALSGKAAAMGQGVIGEVAQRMVEQFAANLATMLEPAAAAAPSNGGAEAVAGASATPSAPPPSPSDALPVGQLAAGVLGSRLKDRRVGAIAAGAAVVAALLILRFFIRKRR
jgi:carbon monoxide dehydrogenase subunit G